MKILIGYDGSEGADVGIEGLRRAGLPARAVEALVVTVAEVWLPPPPGDEVLDDTFPLQIPEGVKRMRARAARLVEQAEPSKSSAVRNKLAGLIQVRRKRSERRLLMGSGRSEAFSDGVSDLCQQAVMPAGTNRPI
jgi:hypothetical protein